MREENTGQKIIEYECPTGVPKAYSGYLISSITLSLISSGTSILSNGGFPLPFDPYKRNEICFVESILSIVMVVAAYQAKDRRQDRNILAFVLAVLALFLSLVIVPL